MATEKNINTQMDSLDMPVNIPTSKLDADQYSADDLDGVTESLFGSGNIAYASLQASQSDAALANQNGGFEASEFILDQGDKKLAIDTDRPLDSGDTGYSENLGQQGAFANTTVGSIGASTLSSDAGSFSPDSGLNISSENFFKGNSSSALRNSSGNSSNPNASTIDNSDNSSVTTENTNSTTTTNINNSVTNGDDITEVVENFFEGDLLQEIIDTVNNEVTEVTETLSTTINNATTNLSNILNQTNVSEVINNVTNITNEVTDIITNTINEILGEKISLDLDLGVLDTLGAGLGVSLEDTLKGNLNLEGVTDNLSTIVNDLTGLSIPSISLLNINTAFDLLGGGNIDDGNDITIAGIATPDIDLDIVEDIIGDIDISINTFEELLDANNIVSLVEDTVGTLNDLNLADTETILNTLENQDLEGALDAVIGDIELSEEIDLAVENLLEDTGDLLGGLTDDMLDSFGLGGDGTEEEGLISQTADPVVEDIGNILDDVTDGATEDITDTLEEGVDTLTDITDNLTGGLLDDILGSTNDNENGADSDLTADLDLGIINTEIVDEVVDVAIDPVEDLVGDLDLGTGLSTDLLGNSETDNGEGDTDITIETDIDIVDNTVADITEEIPLDAVEEITGDIDLDLDVAADLLNELADPLVNEGEGGTGEETLLSEIGDTLGDVAEDIIEETNLGDIFNLLQETDSENSDTTEAEGEDTSWTESTIDADGLFDDIVDGLGGDSDILPDPIGTVGEGLGILNTDPDAGGGGGLFGGGLFG